MSNEIVPFGKYKGQPIEAVQQDRQYLDWLLAQSWFKDRYGDLFTVIINNFQESSDTPEHNAMHVKFLDDEYVISLLAHVVGFDKGRVVEKKFECDGWDLFVILQNITEEEHAVLIKKEIESDQYIDSLYTEPMTSLELQRRCDEKTKKSWEIWNDLKIAAIYIEIKPTISDDFPSIMRQIKSNKREHSKHLGAGECLLVVGSYTGIGATEEQFISFMANEGITVIFDR